MRIYLTSAILILLILIASSLFKVEQRKYAVIFQFGEAVRVIDNPGLNIKIPFIQNVEFYDKRILHVNVAAKELTASDGKRIIVDAFTKFSITDPVKFYKTVYNQDGINVRLNRMLESAMRKVIGKFHLITMLSSKRNDIMQEIKNIVNSDAKHFGVNIQDVRILRADLPKENSTAIYRRMQTEREKEAKQIRAEGAEEAAKIRSAADKEKSILLAEAQKKSEIIKGQGEASAAIIYNNAYSIDKEFYNYYRTMDTYNKVFENNTNYILSPDSKFLDLLKLNSNN